MLTIGEFSRLTHLSVRTLRRYHEATLLEPAVVDETTGYRYYAVDQIPTAQVIHRLRELDVPLGDVQRILRTPDPGVRAALVADHLQRLEAELDRTRAAVVVAAPPAPARPRADRGRAPCRARPDGRGGGGRGRRSATSRPGSRARWPSWKRPSATP